MTSTAAFLLCLVPFVVGQYQYVYQYDDGALKMLMNKPASALCNCEADLVVTYDDDDALDAGAAAAAIQQALGAVGVNAGVLPAGTTHTAHTAHTPTVTTVHTETTGHVTTVHTESNSTVHTVHTESNSTVHTVHTPSVPSNTTVHTPHSATTAHTVHTVATVHTAHGTAHTETTAHSVHAPSVHSVHSVSEHTAHTPTPTADSHTMGMKKGMKKVRAIAFEVSVDTPCGEEPSFDDEAAAVAALEASLGVDVLTATFSNAVCTSCSDVLTNIAEVCPGEPTVALCQDVASAILCSPEETDTAMDYPDKQTCAYDFSSLDDLESYYETQCDNIGGAI